MIQFMVFPVDGLNAGRIVDVGDGWDLRTRHVQLLDAEQSFLLAGHGNPLAFGHRSHQEHVRTFPVDLKILRHFLRQDCRRERAERLPEFDLQVHDRLHRC